MSEALTQTSAGNPPAPTPSPSQAGAFPCPRCKALIRFPVELLLSHPAIYCSQCGLELQLDPERSAAALAELRKYATGMQEAQRQLDESQPGKKPPGKQPLAGGKR